jgi:hypothetical protein
MGMTGHGRARPVLGFAIAVLVAACSGATASVPPTPQPTVAVSVPSKAPTAASSAAASTAGGASTAIVGEWVGVHDCEHIVAMLKAAKLDAFIPETLLGSELIPPDGAPGNKLKDPAHPCAGAVQQRHSHFFTADGAFGSKDFHAFQVDSGRYELDGDTVTIKDDPGGPRPDEAFGFHIAGDQLTLTPPNVDISTCTTKECRFTAAWVLMVAMPGQTWTRGIITP